MSQGIKKRKRLCELAGLDISFHNPFVPLLWVYGSITGPEYGAEQKHSFPSQGLEVRAKGLLSTSSCRPPMTGRPLSRLHHPQAALRLQALGSLNKNTSVYFAKIRKDTIGHSRAGTHEGNGWVFSLSSSLAAARQLPP